MEELVGLPAMDKSATAYWYFWRRRRWRNLWVCRRWMILRQLMGFFVLLMGGSILIVRPEVSSLIPLMLQTLSLKGERRMKDIVGLPDY